MRNPSFKPFNPAPAATAHLETFPDAPSPARAKQASSVGNRQDISHFENGKSVSPPKFGVFLAPIKCKYIKDLSAISAIIQRHTP